MTYSVLRMAGRMPSVPFSTLAVVVRKFQLMCDTPRTSTMPRMPATSAITSTAAVLRP